MIAANGSSVQHLLRTQTVGAEVSPNGKIKVYGAGRISTYAVADWRREVFPDLEGLDDAWFRTNQIAPKQLPVEGRLEYQGPFYVNCTCGHRCRPDPGTHGSARACSSVSVTRRRIVELCREWIRRSDVVFVWLDDVEAYGTLAEVGYAAALGKPVWLAEPTIPSMEQEDELWFVRSMATVTLRAPDPLAAFEIFSRSVEISRPG